MTTELWVYLGVACIVHGFAGAVAANSRNAAIHGFAAGFFLGPFGVIAALGIDNRPQCPRCAGRLDGPAHVCQHCRVALSWPHRATEPIIRPEHQQQDAAQPSGGKKARFVAEGFDGLR